MTKQCKNHTIKSQSNFRKTLRDIRKRVCYHKTVTTETAMGEHSEI